METIYNAPACPQQCWKICANGSDPTLFRYASTITERKKCWELLARKFDQFQTSCNNSQQIRVCKRTQHATPSNVGSCWPTMLRPSLSVCSGLKKAWCLMQSTMDECIQSSVIICVIDLIHKWRSIYNSFVEVQISLPSLDTIQ